MGRLTDTQLIRTYLENNVGGILDVSYDSLHVFNSIPFSNLRKYIARFVDDGSLRKTSKGIVEHTGHGVPVIVSRYGKDAFEISNSYIRVVIPFNNEVLLNHGAISGVISGVNRDNLDDKENEVLSGIEDNPNISAKELSELLNIPFRSVQRYISNLREKEFIDRVGANKNGYWKVIK